jgi:hypothetical protein
LNPCSSSGLGPAGDSTTRSSGPLEDDIRQAAAMFHADVYCGGRGQLWWPRSVVFPLSAPYLSRGHQPPKKGGGGGRLWFVPLSWISWGGRVGGLGTAAAEAIVELGGGQVPIVTGKMEDGPAVHSGVFYTTLFQSLQRIPPVIVREDDNIREMENSSLLLWRQWQPSTEDRILRTSNRSLLQYRMTNK